MGKILVEEDCFSRLYIEYVDECIAKHTQFIWSYELKKFVPYDSYEYDIDCDSWDEYVEVMLMIRPKMKLI